MFTNCVVAKRLSYGRLESVLTKAELLLELKARGIKNARIAEALNVPSSRVTEIRRATPGSPPPPPKGKIRELTYDEGVKLIQAFELDGGQGPQHLPQELPIQVFRLAARYLADSLGAQPSEDLLQEMTRDLKAFAEYVADPTVRKTLDSAQGFFRAVRSRRQEELEEAPPENDPHPVR